MLAESTGARDGPRRIGKMRTAVTFTDAEHRMTRAAAALVLVVSLATLGGALAFEHWGGLAPCPMCLWQRPVYYAAIPAAALVLALGALGRDRQSPLVTVVFLALALGFAVNAALGVYHAGVEWGWWPGPAVCAGLQDLPTSFDALATARVVRCDVAPWRDPLGLLSLAGYSAIISAALAAVSAAMALRRINPRRTFA